MNEFSPFPPARLFSGMNRRDWLAMIGFGAATACGAGNSVTGSSSGRTYRMGERVVTGQLIYSVLETEWLNALGTRVPKNKFLSIRLTINNSGSQERSVPLLTLIDAKGKEAIESSEGDGLEEWLGVLRNLAPTETVQGRLLFDVPQDAYRLEVTDGGEPGSETLAYVEIPLRIEEKTSFAPPGADTPAR